MTGDHPRGDRSRRASLPCRSPVGRDKWHAKSPAQGKCPAILPHRCLILRDGESVSVPTFTLSAEAWGVIHKAASPVRGDPSLSTGVRRFGRTVHRAAESTGPHSTPGNIVDT